MTATVLTTLQDFIDLPDDGVRRELVRGEVREMTPASFEHLVVRHRIERLLGNFVHDRGLGVVGGEGGFVFGEDPPTVLAPDIVFVRSDRVPQGEDRRAFPSLAPDLVVEVLSPSNSAPEMVQKIAIYLAAGVRTVWTVEPGQRSITVHHPDRTARTYMVGEAIDGGDVLPGFTFAVADAFA